MKFLPYLILSFGLLLTVSCSNDDTPTDMNTDLCKDNTAEYLINGEQFNSEPVSGGGEFLTPDGNNCGVSAVIDLNQTEDFLLLVLSGESHRIRLQTFVSDLNEKLDFELIEYTDLESDAIYNTLLPDFDNYILFTAYDEANKTLEAQFNFKVENSNGDNMVITNGQVDCEFQSF